MTEGDSGSANLTFTVSLSAASGKEVTVGYSDAGSGDATSGTDYTALTAGTLTFAAGDTSQTFDVSVTGDTTDEPNETVKVSLGSATNATVSSSAGTGTGTITDDDDAPELSIDSPSVAEGDSGSKNLTFTVSLSTASGKEVTVDWAEGTGGTATSGTDYTAITGGTLTFAAGTTSQTFDVSVTGDVLDESNETVVATLSNAANATIGTATGTGTITDDDDAPTLSIDSPSVPEGDSGSANLTFTVSLSAVSGKEVTVDWAEGTGGTATSGTDYTAITGGTLTFAAGTTSQTFDVSVTGDVLDESNETVVATLSNAANATIGTATGTGTITDDDDAPTLSIDSPSVPEGDSGSANLTFTVSLSAASGKEVTVDWAEGTGGTATSGTDYTAITGGTLTFAAGTTSQTFDVSVTGDVLNESNETVVATLSNAANATIGTATGTGTITDDDDAPTLSIDSPSVPEGDSGSANLTFTVSLSAVSGKEVTVDWAEGTGGTATSGTDYTAITGGTLTFAAGTTSQTFDVSVTGDVLNESNETVVATLSNAANATIGTATGTGTITDDDDAPTLSIDSPSVPEGDSGSANLTFTVSLSAASGKEVTVDWAEGTGGTATSGTDYTAITGGTLTFAAGTTSQTFDVSVTGDVLNESNETVVATLSAPTNAAVSTTAGTGTGTITDDDGAPTLSIDSPSVTEGDSGSANLTFTVSLDAASGQQVTVQYADAGTGTATSGTDYTAITGGTLTFAVGTTSRTFDVSVTGDVLDESNETVVVSLSAPTNAAVSTTAGTGTGTITDDDGAPTLSIDSPSVTEGDSGSKNLTFTVTLSPASGQQVTVQYADAGTGTATSGTDYTAITGGTLTFAVGTTSRTFDVSVTGDVLDESNETVVVSLSAPTNAAVSTTAGTGTGTITDDDGAPTLSIDSPSVTEGDSGSKNLTFTVTLSPASGQQVTVQYADAGTGTATSGTDYTAITGGTLTFAAGTTSETFNVSVTGDVLDESNETVLVSLSAPTNAAVSTTAGTGTGTITDNDGVPTLSIDSPSVTEGDSGSKNLTFTVTLSPASGQQVTVRYADAGTGTATSGTDYTAITGGTLTFAAGTTSETFNVSVTGDVLDESNETVLVSLSAPTNAAVSTTAGTGTGTITDNDGAPSSITLSVDDNSVGEGDGATTITVTATVDGTTRFAEATTVSVSVAGSGTATAVDFAAVTDFDIEIAAGAESKTGTFTLTPTDDAMDETDETVTVSGTSGSLTVHSDTITLTDNDGAPSLSIDSPSVTEGDGGSKNLTFTVSLSAASAVQVTVDYADAGTGTAASGTDYTAITGGTLTFAAGTTTREIAVSVTGDTDDEPDETVVAALSNGINAAIGTGTGTGTITNDDGTISPPVVRIPTFGDATVPDQVWTQNTAVSVLTLPTATGGNGTLTYTLSPALPAGVTLDAASHEVAGTPAAAMDETVYTWTATDEDGDKAALTFHISVAEDLVPMFGDATVPDQVWTQNTAVSVLTLPTATGGNGTLTYTLSPALPAGVTLDAASHEVAGTPAAAMDETVYTWTATDEDGDKAALTFIIEVWPQITFSLEDAEATEGDDVLFMLKLSAAPLRDMVVRLTTTPGTATADKDYMPVPSLTPASGGEVTAHATGRDFRVAAGQTSVRISVRTIDDETIESRETFMMNAVSVRPWQGSARASTTGTIIDNDNSTRANALAALLASFGRTLAVEAVSVVGERFADTTTGTRVTLSGHALSLDPATASGTAADDGDEDLFESIHRKRDGLLEAGDARSSSLRELLTASSFSLSAGRSEDDPPGAAPAGWTMWGRAATSRFSGRPASDLETEGTCSPASWESTPARVGTFWRGWRWRTARGTWATG